MRKIFRFDDICINTNMKLANEMADFILDNIPNSDVLWCISPLVHDMTHENEKHSQRIFPSILNAHSDYRLFFKVDKLGIPEIKNKKILTASHGLVHVDHRLMPRVQQEMSILISCSLAKSKVFVPPFNKWNKDTEDICIENGIQLVKFEDGWLSMEHNHYHVNHYKWYLHSREFNIENFSKWFNLK